MVFGGPTTRATRPGDENSHFGAAGSGGRYACRRRGRRSGASAETMETRDHRAQGRCRLPADGGQARLRGTRGPQARTPDDQVGLKALLAGELDSYEGGVQGAIAVGVRGGDVKIMGCHWVVVPHGIMVK